MQALLLMSDAACRTATWASMLPQKFLTWSGGNDVQNDISCLVLSLTMLVRLPSVTVMMAHAVGAPAAPSLQACIVLP